MWQTDDGCWRKISEERSWQGWKEVGARKFDPGAKGAKPEEKRGGMLFGDEVEDMVGPGKAFGF